MVCKWWQCNGRYSTVVKHAALMFLHSKNRSAAVFILYWWITTTTTLWRCNIVDVVFVQVVLGFFDMVFVVVFHISSKSFSEELSQLKLPQTDHILFIPVYSTFYSLFLNPKTPLFILRLYCCTIKFLSPPTHNCFSPHILRLTFLTLPKPNQWLNETVDKHEI